MIEELIDRALSEYGLLVAALGLAVYKLWRRLNSVIDRQWETIARLEKRKPKDDTDHD